VRAYGEYRVEHTEELTMAGPVEPYMDAIMALDVVRQEIWRIAQLLGLVSHGLFMAPGQMTFSNADAKEWPTPERIMQLLARYREGHEKSVRLYQAIPPELRKNLITPEGQGPEPRVSDFR
jgi:hypothetical protein